MINKAQRGDVRIRKSSDILLTMIGGVKLRNTRLTTRTNQLKKWLMKSSMALLVVAGSVPLSPAMTHADPSSNGCGTRVALINGSFEEPPGPGSMGSFAYTVDEVPGWKTTDTWIEIWDYAAGYPAPYVQQHVPPVEGNRYAELNAAIDGMLYQDVQTTPGQTIYWRFSHIGLSGVDTMQLRIGPVTADPYDTSIIQQMSDDNKAWGTYSGTYTVPAGQTMTRFGFEAVSTSTGSIGHGNHLDDVFLGTEPCGMVTKSVSPNAIVQVGDTLTYTVDFKNEGGDDTAGTVFSDNIPVGTEYVPGSLKIVSGPNSGALTTPPEMIRENLSLATIG
ncbi:DUF11 domain-containing protein [Cohnella sp. REN36]|uniref:DUF11 domain-containing protein n=1 Tax=Cohnella sp. REN36 TaxID=2887347 RepID=UPI001D13CAE5|nr:DUF11 domain-containing protein [Cohnella sp. REN36]MCC3376309.1 DUF11 domain-containing protein [Cohnella sp. REN36]